MNGIVESVVIPGPFGPHEFEKMRLFDIHIEVIDKDVIEFCKPGCYVLARILHEYVDMIHSGRGGLVSVETYTDAKGNKMTINASNYFGHEIPLEYPVPERP